MQFQKNLLVIIILISWSLIIMNIMKIKLKYSNRM
jgi:hypothetical protein